MSRYIVTFILLFLANANFAQAPFEFLHRLELDDAKERIIASRLLPDGTLIAVGKSSVAHWDIAMGELKRTFLHSAPTAGKWDGMVLISPDGRRAAILDSFSFRLIRKEKKVSAMAISLETGKPIAVLERPIESIRHAEWSEDGKVLATFSGWLNQKRTEVCFWDGESFDLKSCTLLKGSLGLARLIDNGRHFIYSRQTDTNCLLCTLTAETETAVIETESARLIRRFAVDNRAPFIWSSWNATDAGGKFLAAGIGNGRVAVWNTFRKGEPLYVIERTGKERYVAIAGFADGGRTLLLRRGSLIEARDLDSGDVLYTLPLSFPGGRSGHIITVRASEKLVVADNCAEAIVFAPPRESPLFRLDLTCKTEFDPVSTSYRDFDVLRFDETQRYLLVSSDKQIRIADAMKGNTVQRIAAPERLTNIEKDPNKDDGLSGAVWANRGEYIIGSGADGRSLYIYRSVKQRTSDK